MEHNYYSELLWSAGMNQLIFVDIKKDGTLPFTNLVASTAVKRRYCIT